MKFVYMMLMAGLLVAATPAVVFSDNCLDCHQTFEDENGPSHLITKDVHYQNGLSCVSCHGGDSTMSDMDDVRKSSSFRGVPTYLQVPDFCARCHSNPDYMHDHNPRLPVDQLEKYKTSIHGKRLFEKHDTKVANCVSCHSVHEIGNAKLPYSSTYPLNLPFTCGKCHADSAHMAGYNIPTDQLAGYQVSVHGKALLEKEDLSAPACNDCHGNHGAAPPGINSLAAVCGMCHAIEAELYNASPHRAAFDELDLPMCVVCHSNHKILPPGDFMIGLTDPAVCGNCHSRDDGTKAPATIDSMKATLANLSQARDSARQILDDAETKGMMTTDEEFLMKEVDQSLIQTRTLIHRFDIDTLGPTAVQGIENARKVQTESAGLINQYYFRRKGLAVATLIITLLAIGLYIKIRRMGR